jgi:nickel transport protein
LLETALRRHAERPAPAMMIRRSAAVLLALALPAAALAHGVSHEVERRGAAYAVRARYHGGAPLAGATYQVLPPGEPARVREQGKTDAQGWVSFVPDAPGRWRVRIVDSTGHGGVFTVKVPAVPAPPARPAAAPW